MLSLRMIVAPTGDEHPSADQDAQRPEPKGAQDTMKVYSGADDVTIARRGFDYELVIKWAPELSQRLHRSVDEICEKGLNADDFPSSRVTVSCLDTFIRLHSAFMVVNKDRKEIAVFSEHGGYYQFGGDNLEAQETQYYSFPNSYSYEPVSDQSNE